MILQSNHGNYNYSSNYVRNKVRENIHKKWKNLLRSEINTNFCKYVVKIDESKIISSHKLIIWMFGIIDPNIKETRVRCFLNNWIIEQKRLLPIVQKYVNTNEYARNDEILGEEQSLKTRAFFSNSFRTYQVRYFDDLGFIL